MENNESVIKLITPFVSPLFGLIISGIVYRIKQVVDDRVKKLENDIEKKQEAEKHEREKTQEVLFDKIETVQTSCIDLCKQLARHDERINSLKEIAEKCEKRK